VGCFIPPSSRAVLRIDFPFFPLPVYESFYGATLAFRPMSFLKETSAGAFPPFEMYHPLPLSRRSPHRECQEEGKLLFFRPSLVRRMGLFLPLFPPRKGISMTLAFFFARQRRMSLRVKFFLPFFPPPPFNIREEIPCFTAQMDGKTLFFLRVHNEFNPFFPSFRSSLFPS